MREPEIPRIWISTFRTPLPVAAHVAPKSFFTFVVRLTPQDRPGPVELLEQDEASEVVRQGKGREGQATVGAGKDLVVDPEGAADQERDARARRDGEEFQVPCEAGRTPRLAFSREGDDLEPFGHPLDQPPGLGLPDLSICPALPCLLGPHLYGRETPVAAGPPLVLADRIGKQAAGPAHAGDLEPHASSALRRTRRGACARPRPGRSPACKRPYACSRCAAARSRARCGT